ncbi:MAG: EcsC family protein [Anaerocolumna sp.]
MNSVLAKQMKLIESREEKFFTPKPDNFISLKINPVVDKLSDKIPNKVKVSLDGAFLKGFELVFDKGMDIIEKTYDKEKLLFDYDVNDYAINKKLCKKYIKRIDRSSLCSNAINSSISAIEGGVLGLLGIGLIDIPLFLSVIIKAINEVSLSYGFDYSSEEEKSYVLSLIACALENPAKQSELNINLDELGHNIDHQIIDTFDLKEKMKSASNVLSNTLLTAKFIQGIPVVGAVGGIVNLNIMNKITQFAKIKYKKRYLLKKIKN